MVKSITSGATTMKGRLRISSTVDLGEKFIIPVANAMQKKAPELSFELILGSDLVGLSEEHLDVAISIGSLPDSSLIAKRLGDISRVASSAKKDTFVYPTNVRGNQPMRLNSTSSFDYQ